VRNPYAFQRESFNFETAPRAQSIVARFRGAERERPLAEAPEPNAPREPETLLIKRSWRYTLAAAGPAILAAFGAWSHLSKNVKTPGDWFLGLLLALVSIVAAVAFVRSWRNGWLRRYLVADGDGLTVYTPQKVSLSWSQIEGCARLNEHGRRILRLSLRPGVSARGAVKSGAGTHFDINFRVAERPERSLDVVFCACLVRIGAWRERPAEISPIRPPVEAPRPSLRQRAARAAVFVAALAIPLGAGLFAIMHHPLIEEPPRPIDARQGESVMFLGNSRIYGNDLPKVVRDIADSAGSPIRYDVHMRSWLAATFKELWNDGGDRAALQNPWGKVILQPESGAFWDESSARDTRTYGEKLIRAAEAGGSEVALMANWTRGPNFFDGDAEQAALASKRYGELMARETRALAEKTGADVIDLEGAFAEAEERAPEIPLTLNGNDPNHAGSYLAGLVIYGYLSGEDLAKVDWRPSDLSETQASLLKEIAARHYPHAEGGLRGSIDPSAPKEPN
jgi:hypothetical protein